ncbi:GntR family transcriptional regulator [Actinokineospora xionganensis]|uniref:GntR family transcriptional regulator n=1 Tax=Actinokineospora xionganensis TaxID=2684470 RepID=A0ABR7L0V3_9PSEU|nr:GntR family transcriptional regulator [Actinokineospora xionganensis]MBC6446031.1 GntR family transcriptional regulator [Actinokineospora xionganensis]
MQTKYRLVANQLIDSINRGEYPVGSALPPLHELTRRFDIARGTARSAIAVLVAEGLAVVKQGAGTVVCATAPTARRPDNRTPDREHLHVVLSGWAHADAEVSTRLGLRAGGLVVHRIRHHRSGRKLVQIDQQWIPATVARRIEAHTGHDIADTESTPHSNLITLMRHAGLHPVVAAITVHARMPEHLECARMSIPPTKPVLVTHQVVHDSTGNPVETTTTVGSPNLACPMFTVPVPA